MKSFKLWALPLLVLLYACGNNPSPAPGPTPAPDGELKYSTGLVKDPDRFYGVMHFSPKAAYRGESMPAEYDVETEGGKTPVRNQGSCGSCWAFGGTQTFEIAMQKFGGKTIDFSEQDLVGKYYYGCGGGYFVGEYQVKSGQADEASCPYRASNYRCSSPPVAKAVNWGLVGGTNRQPTDEELQNAILTYGSVSATVGADGAFGNLDGGFATRCPNVGTNHIIALVGWKTNPADGKVYFKIKNSWGTNWGKDGYSYVRRGCWNLAEEASWLAVDKVPCQPPKVRLPKSMVLPLNEEVRLSVKPQTGVTYEWYVGTMKAGDGPTLDVVVKEETVILLKAKNACGNAEVMSKVTVAAQAKK
jgi:hypothetical protein